MDTRDAYVFIFQLLINIDIFVSSSILIFVKIKFL